MKKAEKWVSRLKRLGFLLMLACILVIGCTNSSAPAGEEKVAEKKVLLNRDFLSQLRNNQIGGFDLSIGMSKADVMDQYGAVTNEDFFEGGLYQEFEKLQGSKVYFDGSDRAYAVHLDASYMSETSLSTIMEALGAPVDQGVSMVDGKYYLFYEAGDNSVFITAADLQSPAHVMKIINKVMVEESPQKHSF